MRGIFNNNQNRIGRGLSWCFQNIIKIESWRHTTRSALMLSMKFWHKNCTLDHCVASLTGLKWFKPAQTGWAPRPQWSTMTAAHTSQRYPTALNEFARVTRRRSHRVSQSSKVAHNAVRLMFWKVGVAYRSRDSSQGIKIHITECLYNSTVLIMLLLREAHNVGKPLAKRSKFSMWSGYGTGHKPWIF